MAISDREDTVSAEDLSGYTEQSGPGDRWSGFAFSIARLGAGVLILLTLAIFVFYLPRFRLLYWDMNLVRLAVALSPAVPRWLSVYYLIVLQYFTMGVSITVGLLVYFKRVLPRSSKDWTGLLASLTLVMGFLITLGPEAPPPYPFTFTLEKLLFGIYEVLSIASIYFLVMFVFIFPDGRFVPSWMRWVAIIFSAAWVILLSFQQFNFGEFTFIVAGILLLSPPVLAFIGQIYRYRRVSTPEQRQQTKWVLYSLTVILLSLSIIGVLTPLILPPDVQTLLEFHLGFLVAIIIPLSIGVSILRYRLWNIDLIIRRTLVYGALTLLLAMVYFTSVVLLQQVFRSLTGQSSPIAVVVSTLVIAALFTPLRHRVQEGIDRRFYRRKYDAVRMLESFAATARDEVELDALTVDLLRVVQDTMQPEQTSLWLIGTPTATDTKSKEINRSLI
jgi:hypothetical protein